MGVRIRLLTGRLHYDSGVLLYTASSGAVPQLDELYLILECDGQLVGLGGIRTNISYLSGIPSKVIEDQAVEWARQTNLASGIDTLIDDLHSSNKLYPPARALIDQTLHDARARSFNVPLCALWGIKEPVGIETNQTLFWCEDNVMLRNAERYVNRGFKKLKLRMGVGSFEQDINRLELLRERFDDTIKLSADVNGQWTDAQAIVRVLALEKFDLDYLEQPVAALSWETIAHLADQSPMRIMLDESMSTEEDVERIINIGGQLAAHLKLVKCGGMKPLICAGRRLSDAGVTVMVGQMNEGGLATSAAAHCAMVLNSQDNELYGADGLIDDPAEGLEYKSGRIHIPAEPGLGLAINTSKLQLIWEENTNINALTESKQQLAI